MNDDHFIQQCRHGCIVMQCRCIGPKRMILVDCPPECVQHEHESYVPKHAKLGE